MRDADDLDEELDRVLIGGREEREVRIEPYSDEWPRRFSLERKRIETALGATARRIEHIGSTAVPGLAAKPVVDILVSVEDPDDEGVLAPLERVGYRLRVREPGHRMFRTPERDVHIHVWAAGSDDEHRYLPFRDWLRSDPDDRLEYERTKRTLAGKWRDTNYYARAKSPVVDGIMERARRGQIERFYDAVPRSSARVEEHGSLVLFLQIHDGGHPFYARPAYPAQGTPTVEDVVAVRARQRELGVPESFEWVHDVTPGLLEVADRSGLKVLQAPLLVLDPAELPPPDPPARMLNDAPEELGVVARLAFSSPGTEPGLVGVAERDAALTGLQPTASRHRHAVAELPGQGVVSVGTAQRAGDVVEIVGVGTLPSVRREGLGAAVTIALARDALDRGAEIVFLSAGSETIAQVYERVGFHRIGTACIAEP